MQVFSVVRRENPWLLTSWALQSVVILKCGQFSHREFRTANFDTQKPDSTNTTEPERGVMRTQREISLGLIFSGLTRAVTCAFLVAGTFLAMGAIRVWDGSYNGYWSEGRNWSGDTPPRAGDDLVFPAGAANLVNTNDLTSLTFRSITVTGSNYIFRASGGGQLQLTDGISAQFSVGFCYISMPVRLAASQTWECINASARLEMLSDLELNLGSYTLTVQGAGQIRLGAFIGGTGGLTKNGTGTLRLDGSIDNTYSGTTRVNAGVMELAKSGLLYATAIPGALIIGDGSSSAEVRLHGPGEIADSATITVNANGILNLNNYNETVASLTLQGGSVTTGTGRLTLNGDVTVLPSAAEAAIYGNLAFSGGLRTISVGDGTAFYDLSIYASMSDAGGGLLITNSTPVTNFVCLLGSNSFTGPLTIANVRVAATTPWSLGATNGGTTVRTNSTLWLTSTGITNESLTLDGGATLVAQMDCVWAGQITLNSGTATVQAYPENYVLEVIGPIIGVGGCTKTGAGKLRYSGAQDNSYSGATLVKEGILELNKSSYWWAIGNGSLTIGDGMGGDNADVVRYVSSGTDQLRDTVPITINRSGLLDLNNNSDSVGNITMTGGTIRTGTGKITPGNITATAGGMADPAIVEGNLELSTTRTFNIQSGSYSPGLVVHASISGSGGLTKTGYAGLNLMGSNAFAGLTVAAQGTLLAGNSYAFGSTNSGTVVSNGASLVLAYGINVGCEPLSIAGSGDSDYGALWSGNAEVVAWAGPITLAADTVIGVIGTNGQMTLSGQITGPGGFTKIGEGTLIFSGSATNNYAGDTRVHEGTLRLAKTGGAKAISHGTLYIGDGVGGEFADRVVWAGNWQMTDVVPTGLQTLYLGLVPVIVQSSGWMNLNGYDESVPGLTMHAGWVETGSGVLWLDGDVSADSTATNMAIIEGHVSLLAEYPQDPSWPSYVLRTFDVVGTNSLLSLRANLSSAAAGLRKTGTGELSLSGANDYLKDTIVSAGVLSITSDLALGCTNKGTIVEPGATLALSGFGVVVTNETLVLAGDGFQGQGALKVEPVFPTSNFWSGEITLSNDTRIGLSTDSILNLACPICGPGGLTKIGTGRLRFSGSVSNSYGGTTRVQAGTLELQKSALNGAVPGRLEIGGVATVRLLGHTQIANPADVIVDGVLDLNNCGDAFDELSGSGTVQLGSGYLNLGADNGSSTFAGQITGTGEVMKLGTGTVQFTGNNSYSGTTAVRGGTLIIDGIQPASAVLVESGGTLRGNGWVGLLTVYGRVQPGDPGAAYAGTMFCSNVVFSGSGRFASTLFDNGSDKLGVSGTVQLGNATLELSRWTAPWVGQRFWLIDNDGTEAVSGTFAGLPEGTTVYVDGVPLQLSYSAGSTNDVVLTFTNPPLDIAGVQISWGDGDGLLEPGDCSLLTIHLTNRTGTAILGPVASVLPGAPGSGNYPVDGLWLPHWQSPYPTLPVNTAASNLVPFQIWLGTNWPFGQPVQFSVKLQTTNYGTFVLPLDIATGGPDPNYGGGPCELCPADFRITALLSSTAPVQLGQLSNSAPSRCDIPVVCPGVKDLRPRYYHAYRFINGESLACITVTLTPALGASGQLFSAAYLGEFNPNKLCANFLGTAGAQGNASYSFMVGPRQRFVVVVNQYPTNFIEPVSYTLQVTNGSCQPWLEIERPSPEAVAVKWTSAAVEHQLQATPTLSPPEFVPVTNQPVVIDGKCTVTNQPAGEARFYRLRAEQ